MSGEQSYDPSSSAPGLTPYAPKRKKTVVRDPIISSSLQSVGYDAETHDLHVEFKSGKVYVYKDVPAHVHRNLFAASSPGGYHANYVAKTFSGYRAN